jgi:acyl-CoA thioester hydrolase
MDSMSEFKFYQPISVRYGDLDPQWHVNNSRFLTYMEQARFAYLVHVGLWDGADFLNLGLIVADAHVAFAAPIFLLQKVRVGARVGRIGNKSLVFEHVIEEEDTGKVLGSGEMVMVAYDYHTHHSIPVSAEWRAKINLFEGTKF